MVGPSMFTYIIAYYTVVLLMRSKLIELLYFIYLIKSVHPHSELVDIL